ncbi:MAG: integration host factor subunit alpha [Deltaproteobacteria bacterium]|nr:integration host factor subunit alpha [Deltaproteobacteria bacterium]
MTVTKTHLTDSIHARVGLSKGQASTIVESLLETIKKTLASGEDLLISGFGKFSVLEKDPRNGRNPQTGEDLVLGARRVVTFRGSPVLRKKMNSESDRRF